MAECILVQGNSGIGKSYSMLNLDKDDFILLQSRNKRLPFKHNFEKWDKDKKSGSIIQVPTMDMLFPMVKGLVQHGKRIFVLDDFQYFFAKDVYARADEKNYDKWTELAKMFWDTITRIQDEVDEDVRVYILTHTQDDDGKVSMKTAGKMITNTITPEGIFTIVIGAEKDSDGNYFTSVNNGRNTLKAPVGMFNDREPNDLKVIDDKICSFYNIK